MVFVVDKNKQPLMPCTEKRARLLRQAGRAVVCCRNPFTIRLKDRVLEESSLQPLRIKIDPGSKETGFAVMTDASKNIAEVVLLGEIHHKPGIKQSLDTRRAVRRNRRNRHTRYRQPRFLNRHPSKCACCGNNARHGARYCKPCHDARKFVDSGYRNTVLPPSLQARVDQTMSVVLKIRSIMPLTAISLENVKFDTQLLENPDIEGVEYQHGTLYGYEVKEYLLEKFNHKCAYCGGLSEDPVLEAEHFIPRNPAHGPKGTNRISNLTIACNKCNDHKDNLQPDEWLAKLLRSHRKIDKIRAERVPKVMAQIKKPLVDAAFMNATRWELQRRLSAAKLPIECGTGAQTKIQRIERNLPKTHYYDACSVGKSTPEKVYITNFSVLIWSGRGRGTRQMAGINKFGFPIRHRACQKSYLGFQTGDHVIANIPSGKYQGTWSGSALTRASGYFDIRDYSGKRVCQGISYKYLTIVQRNNGWTYGKIPALPPHG